jgi:hypothetical protein
MTLAAPNTERLAAIDARLDALAAEVTALHTERAELTGTFRRGNTGRPRVRVVARRGADPAVRAAVLKWFRRRKEGHYGELVSAGLGSLWVVKNALLDLVQDGALQRVGRGTYRRAEDAR